MNKKERVEVALRGGKVDRPPVSAWGHFTDQHQSPQHFIDATIEDCTRYNWDFLKMHPRASYHVENWGTRYDYSTPGAPILKHTPIQAPSDWKRLRQHDGTQGVLADQFHCLQLLKHAVGYDAFMVQTLCSPLEIARQLAGRNDELLLTTIKEDRKSLHAALRTIPETFTLFAIACLEYGADGFYYVVQWARKGALTQDQYREFGEQYDLELLDALKSRSKFTVLHLAGNHVYFDLFGHYPAIDAIHWDASGEGNPDLYDGKRRSGKAVMGGVSVQTLLSPRSTAQIEREVQQAREATRDQHFLLAPSASLTTGVPVQNLETMRQAVI